MRNVCACLVYGKTLVASSPILHEFIILISYFCNLIELTEETGWWWCFSVSAF